MDLLLGNIHNSPSEVEPIQPHTEGGGGGGQVWVVRGGGGVGVCRGQEILGYNTHNIQHTYNRERTPSLQHIALCQERERERERLSQSILFPRLEGKEVS